MPKKFLEAGKIVGTHGVRGDLKVQSWCDSPEVLCDFDTLYLDEKTPVTVEKAQVHKNVVLMHIKGIDTVEAAEAMRNKVLHLDREDVELPEDLVFIQDILVAPERQRRGIGTALLRAVLERFNGVRQIELDDLREMAFGKFEGRAVQELVKDPEFAQWMDPTSRTVPAGAEDRQMFFNRTSSMLMKMFEYMLRTHTEEAACVTHGGVIMNMLSQHALPFRKPEEWMTDPGAGYSVRLDAEMWMRDHLAEAYDVVPHGYLDGME